MTFYSWKGTGGDWNTAANWTPDGVPGGGDIASFSSDATLNGGGSGMLQVVIGANVTLNGGTLSADGGAQATALDITTGSMTLSGGAQVTLSSSFWSSLTLSGTLTMNGGSTLTADWNVFVAPTGTGTLNVSDGAQLTTTRGDGAPALSIASPGYDSSGNIFSGTGSTGIVTVGSGGSITANTGGIEMDGNASQLTVNANGTLTVDDTTRGVLIGALASNTDTVTVTGTDASFSDTGKFIAGEAGAATINVSQGGSLSIGSQNDLSQYDSLYLGDQAGSSGTMNVTDASTTVTVNGQVDVGLSGTGNLMLRKGASMTTGDVTGGTAEGIDIGAETGGTGTFIVQGEDTQLTNTGQIVVGEDGTGTLTIADGAEVTTSIHANLQTSGFDVATGKGSVGTVNITGTDTSLDASDIDLTTQGTATVTVSNAAQVTDSGDFKLAPQDGGNVTFTVTGNNTMVSITGMASIGGTGKSTATLNIQDHATFDPPDMVIAPNAAPTVQTPSTDPVTGFRLDYVQVVNVNGGAILHVNQLTVGQVGNGALIVAGGTITADDTLTIGDQGGSQGQLLLDGGDSSLESSDVTVGNSGKGLLSIGNGNTATTDGDATIGAEAGGSGFVVVGDSSGTNTDGADWSIGGSLTVGDSGSGTLTVTPASSLEVGSDMVIGGESGGTGHVTFTGGSLSMSGKITVGDKGGGSLVFQTGATMNGSTALKVPSVVIGETLGISGSMTVTDDGTSVEIQDLTVGEAGTGSLTVKAGGTLLVDGTADVGADAIGAIQKLTLDTGGTMSVTGDLTLGTAAVASVSIKGGAQLAGDSNVVLGDEAGGAAGVVTVSGTSGPPDNPTASGLGYGLTLTIGNNGIGKLTISNGGLVAPTPGGTGDIEVAAQTGGQGTIALSGSGSALRGTTLSLGGTSDAAGGLGKLSIGTGTDVTISDDAHLWNEASVTLSGGDFSVGTATVDKGASISGKGSLSGSITDNGIISASGGTLEVRDTVAGSGSLNINSGATLDLIKGADGVKIQFKGTQDTLQIEDAADIGSTISGFTFTDTIELAGLTATSAEDTNGTLDVFDGTSLIASFNVSGNYKGAGFDVASNAQGSTITLDASQPGGLPVVTPNPLAVSLPGSIEAAAGSTVAVQGASIADSASGATITLEILTGSGLLSANTSAQGGGGTISAAPDGTGLIVTGTASQINADLSTLTYTATATGSDTLQFVASDDSGNADEDSATVSVPDFVPTLDLPPAQTVVADQATAISGISVNDDINADAMFTIDVNDSTGTLSVDTDGASTVTGAGSTALVITGDLADINADLASLTYNGTSTGLNASADDTIAVSVDDGSGGTSQGSVDVTVDQAPDQTPFVSAPASVTSISGDATAVTGVGAVVNDSLGKTYSVTLSDLSGSLAVDQDGTGNVTGDNSDSITITGDLADINADLASLTYTGVAPAFGTIGADTISLTVSDNLDLTASAATNVTLYAPSTVYWQLPIDGTFSDATKWTPSGPPSVGQIAAFTPGSYFVNGNGSADKIDVAGTVDFTGSITASGLAGDPYVFVIDNGGDAIFSADSSLVTDGSLVVGQTGAGSETLNGGGSLTLTGGATADLSGQTPTGAADALYVGLSNSFPASTVNLDGSGTTLTTDSGIAIGGSGIFSITNGAAATIGDSVSPDFADVDIGTTNGSGTINLSGGSSLTTAGDVVIGDGGYGYFNVGSGSTVSGQAGILGQNGGEGIVTINGSGARWSVAGNLAIGYAGHPSYLTIENGGDVEVQGNAVSIVGSLEDTGMGSTLNASNAAATVDLGSLAVDLGAQATLASLSLTAQTAVAVNVSGGQSALIVTNGIVLDDATLSVYAGGSVSAGSLEIDNGGAVDDNGASLDVTPPIIMDGGTFEYFVSALSSNQVGGIDLRGGVDVVTTGVAFNSGLTITPFAAEFENGSDATLQIASSALGTVSGFFFGDTLDLTDIGYGPDATVNALGGNLYEIDTVSGDYQIQFNPGENFSNLTFALNDDGRGDTDLRLTGTLGDIYTWAQPVDGSFDDAAAWTPAGGPPGPEQTAVFGAGTYTINGPGTVGVIDVNGNVNFTGTLTALGEAGDPQAFVVDDGGAATFGAGTSLTVGDSSDVVETIVGESGDGSLTIDNAAQVTDYGPVTVADQAGATGTLTFDGASINDDSHDWIVGNQGSGQLIAEDGAYLNGLNEIDVGAMASSVGSIDVSDSQIYANTLAIGGTSANAGGKGDLTISDSGGVDVTNATVWGDGTVHLQGGSLYAQETLSIEDGAVVSGYGTVGSEAIVDNGEIDVDPNASLDIEAPISGSGFVAIGTGGTLEIDQLASSADGSQTSNFNVSIENLTSDDLIKISSYGIGDDTTIDGYSLAADGNDTILTLTDTGDTVAALMLNGDYIGDVFDIASDPNNSSLIDISEAPCYCPGTLIETDHGPVAVEALSIGDRIATMSGQARSIKWIGRRSYSGRFALGQQHILPVCIKAGALDDHVPRRDLWISPHHAMYLQGVLIEAKDLVNGISIVQAEQINSVTYIHIELDSHDVIIAEGAFSESFLDDDSRGMFHNAHEYRQLYPDAIQPPVRYCAPRLDDGYEVEAARQRIDDRAGMRPNNAALLSPEPLCGYVDVVNSCRITGWAQNPTHPEAPVCLDIIARGRLIGQVLANRYREDLAQSGLGSGRHSFEFKLPAGLDFLLGSIEVRRSIDGAALRFSKRTKQVEKPYG
jgi:T5SS/PEP-CTERM-associated repeat protein